MQLWMRTFSMLNMCILTHFYARHAMPSANLKLWKIRILRFQATLLSPPLQTFRIDNMGQRYVVDFLMNKVVWSSLNKKKLGSSASQTVVLRGYTLWTKFVELVVILDMLEVGTGDMIMNGISVLIELGHGGKGRQFSAGTDPKPAVVFLPVGTSQWEEQISRLYLLLTVKGSANDVQINLEARKRVSFITKSLFMEMPLTSRAWKTLSFRVWFHYGHADIFDRISHITHGGISKASQDINLNEDICSENLACGVGEQVLSRDICRLGHLVDFFHMLPCYFTTVGFCISTLMTVVIIYKFFYGKLYLPLSGMEKSIMKFGRSGVDDPLHAAMTSQSVVQLGLLRALAMVIQIGLESGYWTALSDIIVMQLQWASVFTYSLRTEIPFGCTILHGGAKCPDTGRGFVIQHKKVAENYRMSSRSHFFKGLERITLLFVYQLDGAATTATTYTLLIFSVWFLVVCCLFSFEWQKIVEHWEDWTEWISSGIGIGMPVNKSWESWWVEELDHLQFTGTSGKFWEVFLSLCFCIYQYGIVYHLHVGNGHKSIVIVSFGRKTFSAELQFIFRMIKLFLFVGLVVILGIRFAFLHITVAEPSGLLAHRICTIKGLVSQFPCPRDLVNYAESCILSGGHVVESFSYFGVFVVAGTNRVYEEGVVGSGVASGNNTFLVFGPVKGAWFADYGTDLGSGPMVPG